MIRHKRYRFLFGLVALVVVVLMVLQLRAKRMVESFLNKKLPVHIDLTYSDMDINILTGTVGFENVSVALSNRDTTLVHTEIVSNQLVINGLGYLKFFLRNTISADEILIDAPDLTYYQHRNLPKKDTLQKGVVNLLKTIAIDKITIKEGKFTMLKNQLDSVGVKVEHIAFNLYNAKIDPEIIQKKIPVKYDDYNLTADRIFVDLGPFENLKLGHLEFTEKNMLVQDVLLNSKYNKQALSKVLHTERDFVSLEVPEFGIEGIKFGFHSNRFFVSAVSTWVSKPNYSIYRDKLVADDNSHKKLYASSLRELSIDLKIDNVEINDGHFVYEERVTNEKAPGKLILKDLNVTIANICNYGAVERDTKIDATALLMGSSPMELSWEFDVMNEKDIFLASGSLSNFKSSDSNSFLRPSLNIEAVGEIEQLYFTISGDAVSSVGDLKMKYHNFKFEVLGKNGKTKNRFWTAVGNIFINDGSKTDTDGFRHGEISVTRDPTKSFFNYLWLNIQEGLIKTLIGDGKKE